LGISGNWDGRDDNFGPAQVTRLVALGVENGRLR
jgi:hypothetical protein